MPGEQNRTEVAKLKGGKGGTTPKPRYLEGAGNLEVLADVGFRILLRVCQGALLIGAVAIFALMIFNPDRIKTVIELIKFTISSGAGFAVPVFLLVAYTPKLLEQFRK